MSDAVHNVPRSSLEVLADEVRAEHRAKFRRHESQYAGTKSIRFRAKYLGCEYVRSYGSTVRKLTAREIEQLQAHVDRCAGFAP